MSINAKLSVSLILFLKLTLTLLGRNTNCKLNINLIFISDCYKNSYDGEVVFCRLLSHTTWKLLF